MSQKFNTEISGDYSSEFSIKNICGCRIVFGPVPVSEMGMLAHGFSKNALVAIDVADRIGASIVIGEPEDLNRLRKMDLPVSEKRLTDYSSALKVAPPEVAEWLRSGERGASSNAMCKRFFGVPKDAGDNHPHDPDDLRRCVLFLDATSTHGRIRDMSDVSPSWASLVNQWNEILKTFREETGNNDGAPKTYSLMKSALNDQTNQARKNTPSCAR